MAGIKHFNMRNYPFAQKNHSIHLTNTIDKIRRHARKEAWYTDSWNPFRKTMRSSSWPTKGQDDVESAQHVNDEPLSASATESDMRPRDLDRNMPNDTLKEEGSSRRSDPDSENTIQAIPSRQPSQEEKARRRFISRFKKDKSETEEEGEKKRPWYKGKVLEHEPFTVRNQIHATLFNSWINILLLAAPIGIALNYAGVSKIVVFVVNFLAIIPLAAMLSFATEEIALHVGESLGGLLNATFGNAVELIVSIIALTKDKIVIVQTSLIGSVLSNLLLVLGMCFFFGGLRRSEQFFNKTVAQTACSLLALAVGSLIIPTCFDLFSSTAAVPAPANKIAELSRGTSIILLLVYAGYLYFQLHTHNEMFSEPSKKVPAKPMKHALPHGAISKGLAGAGALGAGPGRAGLSERPPDELLNKNAHEEADEEPEMPQLHIAVAWATLAISTAIIGLCAEYMVDGIDAITAGGALSEEFVGLILLPIVGNAAEHATAVTVAIKDKMDLAIGVAVGSSMQVSLLLIPFMVVIGWIMGKEDMSLSFDGFQIAIIFVSVLLVNYLVGLIQIYMNDLC